MREYCIKRVAIFAIIGAGSFTGCTSPRSTTFRGRLENVRGDRVEPEIVLKADAEVFGQLASGLFWRIGIPGTDDLWLDVRIENPSHGGLTNISGSPDVKVYLV